MNKLSELEKKSTFDLAFGLATNQFEETEKLSVLNIIKLRADGGVEKKYIDSADNYGKVEKIFKKGSKAEKINKLYKSGKTPKQIYDKLISEGVKVYFPEIYRVTGTINARK